MSHPILDHHLYRRDLPEAGELENQLRHKFFDAAATRNVLNRAGLDPVNINWDRPATSFWAEILDFAAGNHALDALLTAADQSLDPPPKHADLRAAIDRVRQYQAIGAPGVPMRVLLSGDRPFLGRAMLRGLMPELANWDSNAAILVVRGNADSGRTETQFLLAEDRDRQSERIVLLHEDLPLQSTLLSIWREAGVPGTVPRIDADALSTETALFIDFWTEVKVALDDHDRRLWALFDDLDKGPDRKLVQQLAEVLAVRLRDKGFQQRFRLVLLGYPADNLPAKVPGALVRNDQTEMLDDTHVRAFLTQCMKAKGKAFDAGWDEETARKICAQAQDRTTPERPFLESLNNELNAWYRGL
ncbi:effector-associated domain EAD1-containing protein [Cupriavidus pampae]|uniref:effector-associated domain EAD1-containing protein n=1 Tax=Cupriavidus pampae TaxID=659251 RepID=UPI001CC527A2|nr:effector-associated domain EAD1-containing protein [Cupriavidus pampae]